MNFLDLFFFLVLDLGDDYIASIPVGYRILDGLFQVDHTHRPRSFVYGAQINCRQFRREPPALQ
jgi:hypothetical protein